MKDLFNRAKNSKNNDAPKAPNKNLLDSLTKPRTKNKTPKQSTDKKSPLASLFSKGAKSSSNLEGKTLDKQKLIIIAAVVVLAILAAAYFFVFKSNSEPEVIASTEVVTPLPESASETTVNEENAQDGLLEDNVDTAAQDQDGISEDGEMIGGNVVTEQGASASIDSETVNEMTYQEFADVANHRIYREHSSKDGYK